jgi:peroxiredoxin
MMGSVAWVALVLVGVVVVSQVALWLVLLQVVQQQGRILLRLDQLGQRGGVPGDGLPAGGAPPAQPPGLAVGSPLGNFRLPDLSGRLVSPAEWRGRRTLLINWSPTCGYCELIAPELARLDAELRTRRVALVLASHGPADVNQRLAEEYGLDCQILLQPETAPLAAFRHLGTPVAYVLDEAGRVAEPLVIGADAVLDRARRLLEQPAGAARRLPGERPLGESRIERNGLKAGTPAPPFSLPDLAGGTLTLERYRGQRVLLVFTDPHCGPCDALLPDLAPLARAGSERGLQVVVIGRGSADENRAKTERYLPAAAVGIQQRWEVSKAYGIFSTPVGFLIDEGGVIARDVALGPSAIVELARDGMAVEALGRG